MERHLAAAQRGDLGLVDVEAEHLVAHRRETDRVCGTQVAGTEEGQPRALGAGGRADRLRDLQGLVVGVRNGHAGSPLVTGDTRWLGRPEDRRYDAVRLAWRRLPPGTIIG